MQMLSASQGRLYADIQRMLCELMQRDIADPRLMDISITRVERPAGGKLLTIWVHRMGENDTSQCIQRLNRLVPHFMHKLRHALPKRRLPELQFCWDDAFDKGNRVLKLLGELEEN